MWVEDYLAKVPYTVVFYYYDEWTRYEYPGYFKWVLIDA